MSGVRVDSARVDCGRGVLVGSGIDDSGGVRPGGRRRHPFDFARLRLAARRPPAVGGLLTPPEHRVAALDEGVDAFLGVLGLGELRLIGAEGGDGGGEALLDEAA